MALAETLPYGIRDIKLATVSATGVVGGTTVDLPNARTLSFEESEDFEELWGDDKKVATKGAGSVIEWELEAGGISLEALAIIAGGTVTSSGTTPNQVKTYKKLATDARPDFKIEGQAYSESGGDVHCIIWRAKLTDKVSGEFSQGQFFLTQASGEGLPSKTATHIDETYNLIQNETVAAIP
jgi:hypothetical protein